jgi:hypothetical protein
METGSSSRACWRWFALVVLVSLVVVQPSLTAGAQTPAGDRRVNETKIEPTTVLRVEPAVLRTQADMDRARDNEPPVAQVPFRPTLSESELSEYTRVKEMDPGLEAPRRAAVPDPVQAAAVSVPVTRFDGVDQITAGNLIPPDTHGAIGRGNQFVEIVNSNLRVYSRTGTVLRNVRLSAFFGYTAQTLFDPRAVYDSTWNRWVVTAEAFPQSSTVQLHFIAISQTSDATGPFFMYGLDVNVFNNDDFWDYPQLGMDQDAVIITANVFGPTSFRGARMFAVAKARLYNGLGFSVPLFMNLVGTLAPPIVLDQNFRTFLVAAPPAGSTVTKYTLENSSRPNATTLTESTIPVPAYMFPPVALQAGTTAVIDTLDGRFVNASIQNGTSLWNVHSIRFGPTAPLATPKFYEFNTVTNTIIQSGFFFAGNTSHDWNASIAANASRDAFVTWSSTDPPQGIQAQKRFSGRLSTDPPGVIPAGSALFTSPTPYLQFRWGDYSAVTLDPLNPRQAWIINETVRNPTLWVTCIGSFEVFPSR